MAEGTAIFGKGLLDSIKSLHEKADQANLATSNIERIVGAALPVKFPAPPEDPALPEVLALARKVQGIDQKLDAIGTTLLAIQNALGQFVEVK